MRSELYKPFSVSLHPVNVRGRIVPRKKAITRDDNGAVLALVTDKYEVITHEEVLDQIRPMIDLMGKSTETTYLDKGGAVLNYSATIRYTKGLKVGDTVGLRVILRNAYDGKTSCCIRVGAVVLSCTNGMVKDGAMFKNLNVRHTAAGRRTLEFPTPKSITDCFDLSVASWDRYSQIDLGRDEQKHSLWGLQEKGIIGGRTAEKLSGQEFPTAWNLMQAVTYDITHERPRLTEDARVTLLANADAFFQNKFNSLPN